MKAALILAGGKAVRFCKENKALVLLKGKPLLQWVIDAVTPCVDEIVISGKGLTSFGYPVVHDRITNVGPLAGFHAGFSVITAEYTFVTGCDMPFINRDVVAYLFEKAKGYSCSLPKAGEYIEPLCCVYKTEDVKACCRYTLLQGKKRIWDLVQCLPRPRFISFDEMRVIDPHLLSFKNINTKKDLEYAENFAYKKNGEKEEKP